MLTAFITVIAMISSNAQQFGVKAGLNLASVTGDFTDDFDGRASLHFGVVAEFKISDVFSFQPELIYSSQGAKNTDFYDSNEYTENVNKEAFAQNNPEDNKKEFEKLLSKFNTTNSSNSSFSGYIKPYPSNPSDSYYKQDYYNNQLIYDGYMKKVVTSTNGNTVCQDVFKHLFLILHQ